MIGQAVHINDVCYKNSSCRSNHSHNKSIYKPKQVTTGEVDHYVAPGQWEGHQGEQGHEYDEDNPWGLVLGPKEDCMYIIPK